MYLVVGLGNPERRYQNTYHNLGFASVARLAQSLNTEIKKSKCRSLIAQTVFEGHKVIIACPQTYMNLSGQAVNELVNYYKIELSKLIVVYDDVDIELGTIRFRQSGSAGTHNGMRSIVSELGTTEFARLRIGVGKPPQFVPLADYVLSAVDEQSKPILANAIDDSVKRVKEFITKQQ